MTSTSHTLPQDSDRGHVKPHPDGRPWELADFLDDIPMHPLMAWNRDGYLVVENAVSDELIDQYKEEWLAANGPLHSHPDGTVDAPKIGGFNETGYLQSPALMEICASRTVADVWETLLGEPAGVHLNLTGWVSTQRDWHSDYYLNEACVGDHYGAMWVALDDVAPESGPFEAYPSSHLWPGVVTKAKMGQAVDLSDPRWPAHTEDVIAPLIEDEAARRGVEKYVHLPKRGTILFWHGRLYHRGSKATVPNSYRGAAIAHFSGLNHRTDMPPAQKHPRHGGHFFPLRPAAEGVL